MLVPDAQPAAERVIPTDSASETVKRSADLSVDSFFSRPLFERVWRKTPNWLSCLVLPLQHGNGI